MIADLIREARAAWEEARKLADNKNLASGQVFHAVARAEESAEALASALELAEKERDEAAETIRRMSEVLRWACWDLAVYSFRGQDISLGEKADAHLADYLDRAALRGEGPS